MAFAHYIATEIATDHADGLISRREALRRLALVGLSAGAASTMLAACAGGEGGGAAPSQAATTAEQPTGMSEAITFQGPAGQLQAVWAAAAQPRGAVLIIHENRGLTSHFMALPGRLAADGYAALAVDLLSEEGGTASFADPARAPAALAAAPRERLVADLSAAIDELGRRAPGQRVAVMGFCFGGGLTWELLNAGEARLAAAVPFYGPLPESADFSGVEAAVLAVYAEFDARVNASRDAATAALERAGLTYEVRTFPGVDHAFFNDTGPRYSAPAAAEAYRAVLDWFARYLG
ncbi:MAG: dienelactone hydrolase family protein [Egibacteraceae bacterium]